MLAEPKCVFSHKIKCIKLCIAHGYTTTTGACSFALRTSVCWHVHLSLARSGRGDGHEYNDMCVCVCVCVCRSDLPGSVCAYPSTRGAAGHGHPHGHDGVTVLAAHPMTIHSLARVRSPTQPWRSTSSTSVSHNDTHDERRQRHQKQPQLLLSLLNCSSDRRGITCSSDCHDAAKSGHVSSCSLNSHASCSSGSCRVTFCSTDCVVRWFCVLSGPEDKQHGLMLCPVQKLCEDFERPAKKLPELLNGSSRILIPCLDHF